LDAFPPERLSPLLNLASSSTDIRKVVQLSIEDSCSACSEPAASRSSMSIGANCPWSNVRPI
jgi:hypothetical protein